MATLHLDDVQAEFARLLMPDRDALWTPIFAHVGVPLVRQEGVVDISANGPVAMQRLYRILCVFDLAWAIRLHEEFTDSLPYMKRFLVTKKVGAHLAAPPTDDEKWAIDKALDDFALQRQHLGQTLWAHASRASQDFKELA